jgi:alanine racemase
MKDQLSWVEISRDALSHNIKALKSRTGQGVILCPCVKANAYGHGLVETSRIFLESGADWLAVNALYEAETLRQAGIDAPIYIMGHTLLKDLARAWKLDCRIVVYDDETLDALAELSGRFEKPLRLHVKVETGNNRQGVQVENLVDYARRISEIDGLVLEGIATHFANIEDTTNHEYAFKQVERFKEAGELLREAGIGALEGGKFMMHCANSAATILYPETHFDMVRVGIAAYGMWPSSETRVSYQNLHKNGFELRPAFTWKSVVAQIKEVPADSAIGYGCTYKTTRNTRMAIVPVGYYDGYDRGLSNSSYVFIRGHRAKLLGRVCMNIIMVDVTDIPDLEIEDEVVLMGGSSDGSDKISAEQFAEWIGTINYEVTTRVNDRIPRIYT